MNRSSHWLIALPLTTEERWRATALQDAYAKLGGACNRISVRECTSPLALDWGLERTAWKCRIELAEAAPR